MVACKGVDMADWQSLRHHVATRYHVVGDELEKYQNPDFDGLSVLVPTESSERLVALYRRKDYDDAWYVQVYGAIATPGSLDARSCLEWNGRSATGMLALAEGDLYYKRVDPLQGLDVPRLDTALYEAASSSTGLESVLAKYGSV
jgi:hypothetical protein